MITVSLSCVGKMLEHPERVECEKSYSAALLRNRPCAAGTGDFSIAIDLLFLGLESFFPLGLPTTFFFGRSLDPHKSYVASSQDLPDQMSLTAFELILNFLDKNVLAA